MSFRECWLAQEGPHSLSAIVLGILLDLHEHAPSSFLMSFFNCKCMYLEYIILYMGSMDPIYNIMYSK